MPTNPNPRVIAFVGQGELGDHALRLVKDSLVEIVVSENPERFVDCLTHEAATVEALAELKPTHGICAGYRRIIPREIIDLFPHGIMNVHTSLLPYGRGAHPNAWAIAENHPAGVTCHLIDGGIDTGPIVSQVTVEKFGHDTAATLQARLIEAAKRLMDETVPRFLGGEVEPIPQAEFKPKRYRYHTRRKAHLEQNLTLEWDDERETGWVIDVLRARTFPPYPGALYVAEDGKRYRVRIEIEPDTSC